MRNAAALTFVCLCLLALSGCDDESRPATTNETGKSPETSALVVDHSARDTYYVVQVTTTITLYFPKMW